MEEPSGSLAGQTGGGLALLNDSKYGHDVDGGSMRLTLLRSPTAPDEAADIGEQRFTYSLLPFTGSFAESGVVRKGYELNSPAIAEISGSEPASAPLSVEAEYSLLSIDGDGVLVESVKAPELKDSAPAKAACVIRLYESLGGREKTVLRFSKKITGAWVTDMLEDNPQVLAYSDTQLALEFRAFEIKTVLVTF
jgi:alpha-mannosidase